MARIITITSGKGGVGKTSISLNLSLSLASEGFKVCLFDADLGLANVNILTGLYPENDLESVISGQSSLNDILIRDYQGIDIIPGSSGIEKLADLTRAQTHQLISAFLNLEDYDYFIFDTSAGISSQVLAFCMASHEIILVVTTEPTSLTDAYSMLKVLSRYGYDCPVNVVINQVTSGKSAQRAYAQLKATVNRFLSIPVAPLGIVASDKNVRASIISQTPFFILFPDTPASRCITSITQKLISKNDRTGDMPLELFWDRCLSFIETHHAPKIKKPIEKKAGGKKPEKEPDVHQILSEIQSTLSALIKEVAQIRNLVEGNTRTLPERALSEQALPEPGEITLDFESWLQGSA